MDPKGSDERPAARIPDDVNARKNCGLLCRAGRLPEPSSGLRHEKDEDHFVGTRWDLVEQDDLLLMKAVSRCVDRLRYDMFPPGDMRRASDDYRRTLESHPFRTAVVGQLKPNRDCPF